MSEKTKDNPSAMILKPKSNLKLTLMILGVVFLAFNLRAPLTAVGPVLGDITRDLDLSNTSAGLLTTIPLLAFAFLSTFLPRFSKKLGMENILLLSMLILIAGLIIRPLGNLSFLFLGAGLIGIAITIGNVIMPAYIKKYFPNSTGLMTGVYSVSMNLSAALAAGFSISLGSITNLGWKGSIGIWVILALFTLIIWLPLAKGNKNQKDVDVLITPSSSSIWKSRLSWQIALFMGLQSFIYYCIITWWPEMLQFWGISAEKAGWIVSYVQLAQLPATFVVPIIANRMKNQKPLISILGSLILISLLLIIIFKAKFIILACILLGASTGGSFSLAMMFFVLRTDNALDAAALSGMSQSVGYLLAATGPPLFGFIYQVSKGWEWSLLLLFVVGVCLIITGFNAAKNKQI